MGSKSLRSSKAAEVEFGVRQERRVLDRWLGVCNLNAELVFEGGTYHDFDFGLLDKVGLPLAWVEIKVRRSSLDRFNDAIFPFRKHEFAKTLLGEHGVRTFGVTEYGCGRLVEVDLAAAPSQIVMIERHDRRGQGEVPHALYKRAQLKVYPAP